MILDKVSQKSRAGRNYHAVLNMIKSSERPVPLSFREAEGTSSRRRPPSPPPAAAAGSIVVTCSAVGPVGLRFAPGRHRPPPAAAGGYCRYCSCRGPALLFLTNTVGSYRKAHRLLIFADQTEPQQINHASNDERRFPARHDAPRTCCCLPAFHVSRLGTVRVGRVQ